MRSECVLNVCQVFLITFNYEDVSASVTAISVSLWVLSLQHDSMRWRLHHCFTRGDRSIGTCGNRYHEYFKGQIGSTLESSFGKVSEPPRMEAHSGRKWNVKHHEQTMICSIRKGSRKPLNTKRSLIRQNDKKMMSMLSYNRMKT